MTSLEIRRLAGKRLRQVHATLEPGLHVTLTLDGVGVDELIPLLDGSSAPRRGVVLLGNRNPYADPELRRHIGSLWLKESLPDAPTLRASLLHLSLDRGLREGVESRLEEFGLTHLLTQPTAKLDVHSTRMVALALALAKPDLQLLLMAEPLTSTPRAAVAQIVRELTRRANDIPVLVVTASPMTARRFGGANAEMGTGYWRSIVRRESAEPCTLRVTGPGLRPLAAELVRRPRVDSLRISTHANGHDELWLVTSDPANLAIDLVRVTRQLGLELWSLDSSQGLGWTGG